MSCALQKKVVIITILTQSMNQKCNTLKSIIGIFLHSTNSPEKVIQALVHMGILISVNAIHITINSLSCETQDTLRTMGQSLLVAYAFNNFDMDSKQSVLTAEKTSDTLGHLTSGTPIQL